MNNPLVIRTEESGEGTPLPMVLQGYPRENGAGETIHYRKVRVVPAPPAGKQLHDVKDGSPLDFAKARKDEWVRNTNALIAKGRKPFLTKRHDFGVIDPADTYGTIEALERDGDELFATVGIHGDENLKIVARNKRSIGMPGKDAMDAYGQKYEGEWLHHLAICPNPAMPDLGDLERIAASDGTAVAVFAFQGDIPVVEVKPSLAPVVSPALLALASEAAGFPVHSRAAAMLVLGGDDPADAPADPLTAYVRDVADRMALKDWTIKISDEPANPNAWASINCIYGQKLAVVYLSEDWAERSASEKRDDIVHELVHCHGAPVLHLVRGDLTPQLAPAANEVFQASFTRAMEYQTDGLAAAIAPLMPLPPDDAVPIVAMSADGYSFSSSQFDVSGDTAARILAYGRSIPDEDLAGDGRETDVHITVKYGLQTGDPASLARIVDGFGPVVVRLEDVSVFTPDSDAARGGREYDVVKVDVRGPSLIRLNKLITDSLPTTSTFPTYVPHLTIAYVKAGLGSKYVGDQRFSDEVIVFDQIMFSGRDGVKTPISLLPRSSSDSGSMASPYGRSLMAV